MSVGERSQAEAMDPITLEVIHYALISIANQVDTNITRTAFSPYIYEYKDFAVGIVGADGQLLAQSTGGMPPFVADAVGMAVRDGLETYGADSLEHGDVLVCNHAAVQGQHLNNTVMYTPIWIGPDHNTLVGFFAINVHWIDVGGSVPRSTDIFMEGLQLRSVKLWSRGVRREQVYRIIETNTRFPTELLGDIAAQFSGCLLGRNLVAALVERYTPATFFRAVDVILDRSEAAARAFISSMRDGVYSAESFLDGDGVNDVPVPLRVKVVVAGDTLTIDYSGMSKEVRTPINSGYYGGGQTTARVAFMYLIGPGHHANEGIFRPLRLELPQGTILSASPTAPMGNYSRTFPTVIDLVLKALQSAIPARAAGGHYGNFAVVRFMGRRSDGSFFDCNDAGHGGWGACATHDGDGPFRTMTHGDTRIVPTELLETMYPFVVEEFALRQDSGGVGTWRGGLGYTKTYRITEPCTLRVDFDRVRHPPWGVMGGGDGEPGRVLVMRKGASAPQIVLKAREISLEEGDIVRAEIAGGGGYGPPKERSSRCIARDLEGGYISMKSARQFYNFEPRKTG